MPHFRRNGWIASVCAMVLLTALAHPAPSHAQVNPVEPLAAPVARLLTGEVFVTMPKGMRRPLKLDEEIPLGAKIDTGRNGVLLIGVHQGASIQLSPNSQGYLNTWKPAPPIDPKRKPADRSTLPLVESSFVLSRGMASFAVEPNALFRRKLTLTTLFGTVSSETGGFAAVINPNSLEVVSLYGTTWLKATQYGDSAPEGVTTTAEIGGARYIQLLANGSVGAPALINPDSGASQVFTNTAVFVMEAATAGIFSKEVLSALTDNIASVGKAGDIQTPVIVKIGLQCAALVHTGRVSPVVAGAFVQAARASGLNVGNETIAEIETAIARAPAPAPRGNDNPLVAGESEATEKKKPK